MKRTITMKPLSFFVALNRVDDEQRIVEGVAFANEVVDGEGGIRLKRSAMQEATPDYLRWGAVREMHQPSAVGTCCGIEWTEDGKAIIRAKIADDQAWKKIKEGVYKGFSVGVRPVLMRGKDVEKVTWIENSLVDRPKDPDAPITMWRVEGPDMETESEVEVDETPELVRSAIEEFEALVTPMIERGETVDVARLFEAAGEDTITRADHDEQISALTQRMETQLDEVRAELTRAEDRVKELEAKPASQPPVRFPEAINRTFAANSEQKDGRVQELKDELAGIKRDANLSDSEQLVQVRRIGEIKSELSRLGVTV